MHAATCSRFIDSERNFCRFRGWWIAASVIIRNGCLFLSLGGRLVALSSRTFRNLWFAVKSNERVKIPRTTAPSSWNRASSWRGLQRRGYCQLNERTNERTNECVRASTCTCIRETRLSKNHGLGPLSHYLWWNAGVVESLIESTKLFVRRSRSDAGLMDRKHFDRKRRKRGKNRQTERSIEEWSINGSVSPSCSIDRVSVKAQGFSDFSRFRAGDIFHKFQISSGDYVSVQNLFAQIFTIRDMYFENFWQISVFRKRWSWILPIGNFRQLSCSSFVNFTSVNHFVRIAKCCQLLPASYENFYSKSFRNACIDTTVKLRSQLQRNVSYLSWKKNYYSLLFHFASINFAVCWNGRWNTRWNVKTESSFT